MTVKSYLLSLPERLVRSSVGLGAGVARTLGEAALPRPVLQSQLYVNLVDATFKFLIQQVGNVEGVYDDQAVANNFLARRTAGSGLEALGIVAFRASPVWVLAGLADLCGLGRHLIPEIAEALKTQGLLDEDAEFTSVDSMLDGLERTSSRLAATINTPPLDLVTLRSEWRAIREDARAIQADALPSADTIRSLWAQLQGESSRQGRTVFETSTVLAVSAIRGAPGAVRWLSMTAKVGAGRTSQIFATVLLDHYRETLHDIRQAGFATYASRQLRPYVRAALNQFSPERRTLTERLLETLARRRSSARGQRRTPDAGNEGPR